MYAHILLATDGSELATRGLDHAIRLAKLCDARLTIVIVVDPAAMLGARYAMIAGAAYMPDAQMIEAQTASANAILADAALIAFGAGINAETIAQEAEFAAHGIILAAKKVGADLIVMSSHGRGGIGRLLLGSQTSEVLARTKIPVLVTR